MLQQEKFGRTILPEISWRAGEKPGKPKSTVQENGGRKVEHLWSRTKCSWWKWWSWCSIIKDGRPACCLTQALNGSVADDGVQTSLRGVWQGDQVGWGHINQKTLFCDYPSLTIVWRIEVGQYQRKSCCQSWGRWGKTRPRTRWISFSRSFFILSWNGQVMMWLVDNRNCP